MKHLIIGSGIAGIQAAETIRSMDVNCSITLIGGENFLPYSRPMIGMLLEGSISPENMVIRQEEFFDSLRIDHVMGEWVQQIDLDNRRASTDKGKTYSFDRLLVATGADPRVIDVDGCHLRNIFHMRNEKHVTQISQSLSKAKNALVVGCGLGGLKAAQAFLHRGLTVTVVEKLNHPLPLVVDSKAGELISHELQNIGLEVKISSEVLSFDGNGKVKEAHLSDGSRISCDIVVVAIGFHPAVSFIPPETINVNMGIPVNRYLETNVRGIYAAGDVAECTDIVHNEKRANAMWPVAAEQGVTAGMNMAGRKVAYKGSLGRNVFRIGDTDILAGGLVDPLPDETYTVYTSEDQRRKTYRKLLFREDILVGVVMVNAIEQGGVLLSLIHQQIPVTIPKENLLKHSFNLFQLLPRMQMDLRP